MSEYCAIKTNTMTDIANAIRSKGKLTTQKELPIIRHTSNYDGDSPPANSLVFDSSTDEYSTPHPDTECAETIVVNGASSLKVIFDGWLPYHSDVGAYLTINGIRYMASATTNPSIGGEIDITGDSVAYEWKTFFGGKWFYYLEVHAYDASGEEMTTFEQVVGTSTATYLPSEMAAAILAITPGDSSGSTGSGTDGIVLRNLIEGTTTSFEYDDIETVGDYAFYGLKTLESVSLPRATTIGYNAFGECTNLTSINFPQVTTFDGTYQFYSCSNLTEVNFPKLTEVTDNAFRYCNKLVKADFGAAKTFTGTCFFNSPNLVLIIRYSDTKATATSTSLLPANFAGGIYVPKLYLSAYKNDSVWGTWADKIYAIEDYPDICG